MLNPDSRIKMQTEVIATIRLKIKPVLGRRWPIVGQDKFQRPKKNTQDNIKDLNNASAPLRFLLKEPPPKTIPFMNGQYCHFLKYAFWRLRIQWKMCFCPDYAYLTAASFCSFHTPYLSFSATNICVVWRNMWRLGGELNAKQANNTHFKEK